jgi:hypothetical protein
VIIEDGVINAAATTAERDQPRRRERSQVPGERRGQASLAAGRRLDDNLVEAPAPGGSGTIVACRHCAEILGGSGRSAGSPRHRPADTHGAPPARWMGMVGGPPSLPPGDHE